MALPICWSAAETATTSRHEVKLVLSWRCITLISTGRINALHEDILQILSIRRRVS